MKFNLGYCLKGVNKIYVDYYLLSAFLTKTPVKQIFNTLLKMEFVKDNFNIFEKNNTFNTFKKFHKAESIEKKSTFWKISSGKSSIAKEKSLWKREIQKNRLRRAKMEDVIAILILNRFDI